jgi:hypothetical protein
MMFHMPGDDKRELAERELERVFPNEHHFIHWPMDRNVTEPQCSVTKDGEIVDVAMRYVHGRAIAEVPFSVILYVRREGIPGDQPREYPSILAALNEVRSIVEGGWMLRYMIDAQYGLIMDAEELYDSAFAGVKQ